MGPSNGSRTLQGTNGVEFAIDNFPFEFWDIQHRSGTVLIAIDCMHATRACVSVCPSTFLTDRCKGCALARATIRRARGAKQSTGLLVCAERERCRNNHFAGPDACCSEMPPSACAAQPCLVSHSRAAFSRPLRLTRHSPGSLLSDPGRCVSLACSDLRALLSSLRA